MISQSLPNAVSSIISITAVFIAMLSTSVWLTLLMFVFLGLMPVSYTHLKIVVHECSYDENKTRRQDIEIYYSFVGKVDLPE